MSSRVLSTSTSETRSAGVTSAVSSDRRGFPTLDGGRATRPARRRSSAPEVGSSSGAGIRCCRVGTLPPPPPAVAGQPDRRARGLRTGDRCLARDVGDERGHARIGQHGAVTTAPGHTRPSGRRGVSVSGPFAERRDMPEASRRARALPRRRLRDCRLCPGLVRFRSSERRAAPGPPTWLSPSSFRRRSAPPAREEACDEQHDQTTEQHQLLWAETAVLMRPEHDGERELGDASSG